MSWLADGRQPYNFQAGTPDPPNNQVPSGDPGYLGQLSSSDIVTEFKKQFDGGYSRVVIDILTCTAGGTMQQMYANSRPVRSVTIQNLTTTVSTLVSIIASTLGAGSSQSSGSATIGLLLNAGSAANVGGGSVTLPNIDLSHLSWTATNNSDKISVTYIVSGYSGVSKPGTVHG